MSSLPFQAGSPTTCPTAWIFFLNPSNPLSRAVEGVSPWGRGSWALLSVSIRSLPSLESPGLYPPQMPIELLLQVHAAQPQCAKAEQLRALEQVPGRTDAQVEAKLSSNLVPLLRQPCSWCVVSACCVCVCSTPGLLM